ncbi:MAG TPA: metalloprotease PmbA [Nevskiales bacterium]|nr:metalloprotease PmbA [Nevskiales bacterium]
MSTTDHPLSPALPDKSILETLVSDILAEARRQGASAAEAAVNCGQALSVTVRLGEVETLEHHRSRGLGVTVYFDHRKGGASTADWSAEAVRATVQAACDIARHTAADACAGLADPERLARAIPDLDLDHPWALVTEAAIERARECEDAARALDPRIANSEGASLASQRALMVYGNSHGFLGGYASTRHSLSCAVIARSEEGDMQRDGWYTISREPGALEPASAVGRRAAERALRRLGGRRLGTRQVPVLFVPEQARGLIGHFLGAIRGGALYRRASFLLDRLGTAVFAPHIQLREEPHLLRALGSAPFDGEGVATRPRDLVRDGMLQGYLLDSYAARRLGMETTGNAGGAHNVLLAPGTLDFPGLLRELGSGLVVTHLMGQGINLLTGDYSRGAAGFWVENGEIQYPVEEITIAGRLQDMFLGIRAVGADVDRRGGIQCGSLLIERMTVAGQ